MYISICDDDEKASEFYSGIITQLAKKNNFLAVINRYSDGLKFITAFEDAVEPPDIVILDIMMPGENGLMVGAQLRKQGYTGLIIYLTRSIEHTIQAFDVGAFNYVMKGSEFESDRFERVFLRAAAKVDAQKKKYILLNGISEHHNIAIDSIGYFETGRRSIIVYYGFEQSFEFAGTLGKLENKLAAYGFVRIHRSFLVNSRMIDRYNREHVVLHDGTELPVGRQRYPHLREYMGDNAEVGVNDE